MSIKNLKTNCIKCEKETNHTLLFIHSENELTELTRAELIESGLSHNFPIVEYNYHVVKCKGCDYVSYLTETIFLEQFEDYGDRRTEYEQYPPEEEYYDDETFLDYYKLSKLPKKIRKLYEEIEASYEASALLITGIGIRTLIEAICIDQKSEGWALPKKIDDLYSRGYLSKKNAKILHDLKDLGNQHAHHLHFPSYEEVLNYIEIINHILTDIYTLPNIGKKS